MLDCFQVHVRTLALKKKFLLARHACKSKGKGRGRSRGRGKGRGNGNGKGKGKSSTCPLEQWSHPGSPACCRGPCTGQ